MKTGRPMRTVIIAVTVLAMLACLWLASRPYGEVRAFEQQFGIKLPMTAKMCLSEEVYTTWTDGTSGYAVMIYQLSDGQFGELEQAVQVRGWQTLPLADDSAENIFRQHIPDEWLDAVPWVLERGWYHQMPAKEAIGNYHHGDQGLRQMIEAGDQPRDCALALLEPATCKVYMVKWNL